MAKSSWNAGIIRPVAVAPTGPYQDGAASGVWTLDQATFWTKQGLWPTAGNIEPVGLFFGGYTSTAVSTVDKIILGTSGNATSFGNLITAQYNSGACSSSTRAVIAGGEVGPTNVIQYMTYSSGGTATDFGDLLSATNETGGLSNYVRGIFGGGFVSGTATNVIQYITIATTGNSTDFGDLTVARGGAMY